MNTTTHNQSVEDKFSAMTTLVSLALTCHTCGKHWITEIPALFVEKYEKNSLCSVCGQAHKVKTEALEQSQVRAYRLQQWKSLCPTAFQATVKEKLPPSALAIINKVMAWKHGPEGLFITGPARLGKTRLFYLLLEKLFVEDGLTNMEFTSASRFALECNQRFGDHTGAEWMDRLHTCSLFAIDDLGKGRLTDRVENELFGILDYRSSWNLPVIATSNTLSKASFSHDLSEPILGRLREFNQVIVIK